MDNVPSTSMRRKDYMAVLAVSLFISVLIFEFLLITWIPGRLRREKFWEKEVALQEMVELEDLLRAYLVQARQKHKNIEDEIELVRDCLDEFAVYLRKHKDNLSREQIGDLYSDLKRFEEIYHSRLKYGQTSLKTETLSSEKFIRRLLEKEKRPSSEKADK